MKYDNYEKKEDLNMKKRNRYSLCFMAVIIMTMLIASGPQAFDDLKEKKAAQQEALSSGVEISTDLFNSPVKLPMQLQKELTGTIVTCPEPMKI